DLSYDVILSSTGWMCSCLDHHYRQVRCKHIIAVEISHGLREKVKENVVIAPVEIHACLFCRTTHLKKSGIRHNKCGDIQRFCCLYFSGESLRNTARSLRLLGVQVSYQTVWNWIKKYTALMEKYLNKITPQVSDTWRADELFLKVKG